MDMADQEFNVKEPVVEVVEIVEEETTQAVAPVEPPKTVLDIPDQDLTEARRKLVGLIKKLMGSKKGNVDHPRKEKGYFMPLSFAHDVKFDPFSGNMTWNGPPEFDESDEEDNPAAGYGDIIKSIKDKKALIEKRRKEQLYQLNNPDIPSADWTPMFRANPIDWPEYFADEFQHIKRYIDLSDPTLKQAGTSLYRSLKTPQDAADEALGATVESAIGDISTRQVADDAVYMVGASHSFIIDANREQKIIPLPFGQVVQDRMSPGEDRFYQVCIYIRLLLPLLTQPNV
jgi:hypothetical protein